MSAGVDAAAVALGLLADTGLKASAVLLGAGLLTWATRPWSSAAARHAVWACAFAALPALAAASLEARGAGLSLVASPAWLGLWALGALAALSPLLAGLLALIRARRRGELREGVFWTDGVEVPLTFARSILMPASASAWTPEAQRAAHLHERAHLRRGDWWVHVGAWLVCAALWFHPLLWWARRALSLEAERAADDRVLAAGVRPSDYAQQLLGLARGRGPAAALTLGRSPTSARVRAILGAPPRGRRRWPALLLALLLSGVLGPPLVGWGAWSPPPPTLDCIP